MTSLRLTRPRHTRMMAPPKSPSAHASATRTHPSTLASRRDSPPLTRRAGPNARIPLFRKELNKRIRVAEKGKRMRISKRHAWMKRVANGTVMRDPNAVKVFLKFERPGEAPEGLNFYIIG